MENLRPASADLVVSWDRTQVALPITPDPDRVVMAQIQEALQGEKKPCMTAMQYHYNAGKDLTPALGWLDEHIAANSVCPNGHYWKGRQLQKQGKNQEAIAAANKSLELLLELLKDDKNVVARDEYIRLNQEVLAAAAGKG